MDFTALFNKLKDKLPENLRNKIPGSSSAPAAPAAPAGGGKRSKKHRTRRVKKSKKSRKQRKVTKTLRHRVKKSRRTFRKK